MCRRQQISFAALADSLAPGIAVGQAIGRFGNWFNQELYGQPTTLPWGLEIDPAHRAPGFEQYATFHPTFLYESVWNVLVALITLWADRKFRLGRGKVFALYIALYGFGRIFTEHIRLDYSYSVFGPDPVQRGGRDADLPGRRGGTGAAHEAASRPRGRGGVRAGRDSSGDAGGRAGIGRRHRGR